MSGQPIKDEREQSEFNSAITYLNRVNTLLYQCDTAAMELDAYLWFHSLMALYRELSTEMKDDEVKKFDETRKQIAGDINVHINNIKQGRSKGLEPFLYDELHDFEMSLRRIMRDTGLQMKLKESGMDALR